MITARRWVTVLLGVALASSVAAPASGAVRRLVIESRDDVFGARPFGNAGPYEKLTGIVEFALDPAHAANTAIVDLRRAPRDASGRVTASANFMVLRPKTIRREQAVALLEVSNRGGKAALPYFASAAWSTDPVTEADFGDALPLRLGLTLIWVGWQFDVATRDGALRLDAPVATDGGRPIEGLMRSDWTVDEPVATLPLGHRGHRPYPLANADDPANVLTERDGRLAARRVVPREQWRFVEQNTRIARTGGFESGKIYELVYRARDPVVVGIGLAAVRDMMSYAKYDEASPFPVRRGLGLGISQTGRFLRHFLYQGFNTDEAGRTVFDGLFVHTAGAGRGSFNHRFAQPSRDAHRLSAFFYPTDLYPFSGRGQRDSETGVTDGVLVHESHLPNVMFTNTGYEYWGRAASLIHTTPNADGDVEPLPNERISRAGSTSWWIGRSPHPDPARSLRIAGARWTSGPRCGRCWCGSWSGFGTAASRRPAPIPVSMPARWWRSIASGHPPSLACGGRESRTRRIASIMAHAGGRASSPWSHHGSGKPFRCESLRWTPMATRSRECEAWNCWLRWPRTHRGGSAAAWSTQMSSSTSTER